LGIYPVSKRVNTIANDDAQLCEPIEVQEPPPPAPTAARSPREAHEVTDEAPVEDHDPVQQSLL